MDISYTLAHKKALPPKRNSEGDAGFDLFSVEDCFISPFERKLVRTGIHIAIPDGYYGRIAPRSGLAFRNGIDVMAGVIDSSYRGELKVLLVNLTRPEPPVNDSVFTFETLFGSLNKFKIKQGDRIAQLIIEKYYAPEWKRVDYLGETERAENGFGSSGV